MIRKLVILSVFLTVFVAACSGPQPSATPLEDEMMAEEEEMMGEEMGEESMEDEGDMSEEDMMHGANFTVRIENLSPGFEFLSSGVFNTPSGAEAPGPLGPGAAYEFQFSAAPGARLSFATMFVQSNDLFYAPGEAGIALFDEGGNPLSDDVTEQITLWDAGTEVNQEPGVGADQAPRQAGPDTGSDENGSVNLVEDMYSYPAVAEHIQVSIEATSDSTFVARIENISTDASLLLAPGVWVVHPSDAPLFDVGQSDRVQGLEALAEDGDPSLLAGELADRSGVTVLLAPGVWVAFTEGEPIFSAGEPDRGLGLEALAEDGNPGGLDTALGDYMNVVSHGVFNTPAGGTEAGPVGPGGAYTFSFSAAQGERLTFATMFVQSNDLFYSLMAEGIDLFSMDGEPISGDITAQLGLWDAGTEVNQEPGIGSDQAPRQAGPNTGADEMGVVQLVEDMYAYPEGVIRVTITTDG
jgi:hypothetical protein